MCMMQQQQINKQHHRHKQQIQKRIHKHKLHTQPKCQCHQPVAQKRWSTGFDRSDGGSVQNRLDAGRNRLNRLWKNHRKTFNSRCKNSCESSSQPPCPTYLQRKTALLPCAGCQMGCNLKRRIQMHHLLWEGRAQQNKSEGAFG